MIRNSKSILGLIIMPISIIGILLSSRKNHCLNSSNSLDKYNDYYEAIKIKQHLSYKLGDVFIKNIKNPIKWFLLPYELYKTVQYFRKNKSGIY